MLNWQYWPAVGNRVYCRASHPLIINHQCPRIVGIQKKVAIEATLVGGVYRSRTDDLLTASQTL